MEVICPVEEEDFRPIVDDCVNNASTIIFSPQDWLINTSSGYCGRLIWMQRGNSQRRRRLDNWARFGVVVGMLEPKTRSATKLLQNSDSPIWMVRWEEEDGKQVCQCIDHRTLHIIMRQQPFARDIPGFQSQACPPLPAPAPAKLPVSAQRIDTSLSNIRDSSLLEAPPAFRRRTRDPNVTANTTLTAIPGDSSGTNQTSSSDPPTSGKDKSTSLSAAAAAQSIEGGQDMGGRKEAFWATNADSKNEILLWAGKFVWWRYEGSYLPGRIVDPTDEYPEVPFSQAVMQSRKIDRLLVLSLDDLNYAWVKVSQIEDFKEGFTKNYQKLKEKAALSAAMGVVEALGWTPPDITNLPNGTARQPNVAGVRPDPNLARAKSKSKFRSFK